MSDLGSLLAEGRWAAGELMTDACTITRAGTGPPVRNEETGESAPPAGSTVYTGPCRVQIQTLSTDTPLVAVDRMFTTQYTVSIPVGSPSVKVGDAITITAAEFDAQNVGRRFRVRAVLHKSQATAYRMIAEVINE